MPLPALLAVAVPAGAATLFSRAQAGSRARMTAAQAEAHKARLVELLRRGRWKDALDLNRLKSREVLDLGGVNLAGANLSYVNLEGADLGGADLAGADLTSTALTGANLTNANLTDANLYNANLTGANLAGANLEGASLKKTRLPEGLLAPNTRLDAVPWTGTPSGWKAIASLRGARFIPLSEA